MNKYKIESILHKIVNDDDEWTCFAECFDLCKSDSNTVHSLLHSEDYDPYALFKRVARFENIDVLKDARDNFALLLTENVGMYKSCSLEEFPALLNKFIKDREIEDIEDIAQYFKWDDASYEQTDNLLKEGHNILEYRLQRHNEDTDPYDLFFHQGYQYKDKVDKINDFMFLVDNESVLFVDHFVFYHVIDLKTIYQNDYLKRKQYKYFTHLYELLKECA